MKENFRLITHLSFPTRCSLFFLGSVCLLFCFCLLLGLLPVCFILISRLKWLKQNVHGSRSDRRSMNSRWILYILTFEGIGDNSSQATVMWAFGALLVGAEFTFRYISVVWIATIVTIPRSARHVVMEFCKIWLNKLLLKWRKSGIIARP